MMKRRMLSMLLPALLIASLLGGCAASDASNGLTESELALFVQAFVRQVAAALLF